MKTPIKKCAHLNISSRYYNRILNKIKFKHAHRLKIEYLLKFDQQLFSLLCLIFNLPAWKAELVLEAMKLEAYYGECFASARFFIHEKAGRSKNSQTIWYRIIAKLGDLVEKKRRRRPNKTLGTNLLRFEKLFKLLLSLLQTLGSRWRWERVGQEVWVKTEGIWVKLPIHKKGGLR